MSTKLIVPVSIITIVLAGCVTSQQNQSKQTNQSDGMTNVISKKRDDCKYIQRNLTVGWEQRSYWCVPNN